MSQSDLQSTLIDAQCGDSKELKPFLGSSTGLNLNLESVDSLFEPSKTGTFPPFL